MLGGRTRYGLPVNLYHWLVGCVGALFLVYYSFDSPFPPQEVSGLMLSLFILLHVIASFLPYPYARRNVVITFSSSFTIAALLVLGVLPAVYVAVCGILVGSIKRLLESRVVLRKNIPLPYQAGVVPFNIGMTALMWLAAGWIYLTLLKSDLPLHYLTLRNVLCILLTFLSLAFLNAVFLFLSNFLRKQESVEFLRKALLPAFFTEFATIPFGVVMALAYNRLGTLAFLLLSFTLLLANLVLRRLSLTRDDLEEKLRHLTALNRVSKQIISIRDENAVMQLLFNEIGSVVESDNWFVARVDEWLTLHIVEGKHPVPKSLLNVVAFVAKSSHPLLVSNTTKHASEEERKLLLEDEIRSCVAVPVVVADKTHLVLTVYSSEVSAFKREHMQVLIMVADETALALQNAKLYNELTEKVSELERLNTELRQLDRLKSEFLSNVSHELRTPLTSVKGYVEYIRRQKLGPVTPLQSEGLTVAHRNILRLQRMINDLLDYTRLEFKKAPIELRPCRLENMWADVYEQYAEVIESRNLAVHVRIPGDLPVLFVDIQRFTQLLRNLISNAIKFSNDKGRITIRAQIIHHPGPFYHPETYANNCIIEALTPVEITVSDEGIGIPPDALPHIFDRFYQVDSSHTRKYGGTGLGLALVKTILDAHGIPIEVQSQLGRGTTFGMVVPSLFAGDLPAAVKPVKTETVTSPKYLT